MPGRKRDVTLKLPGDAQLAVNLKKENAALQEELAGLRQELGKAAEKIAATEKIRQNITGEIEQLKSRAPALKTVTAEPEALWQGLKSALDRIASHDSQIRALEVKEKKSEAEAAAAQKAFTVELEKSSGRYERSLKILQEEKTEAQQSLESVRNELKAVVAREQNSQIKALAEAAELRETVQKSRLALDALHKKKEEAESLWAKEREGLLRSLEQLQEKKNELATTLLDRQKQDEQFVAALAPLQKVLPALKEVEAKPEPVLRVVLEELLMTRKALGRIADLEKMLEEEKAKSVDAGTLDTRIGRLLEENRSLQEHLDALAENSKIFEKQAVEAAIMIKEKVAAATAAANAQAEQAQKAVARNLAMLETENSSLRVQLESSGKIAFVQPERVSMLLDDFYRTIQKNITGLDVRDSEVRLKVGFGGLAGDEAGFVIPTAGNTQEIKESLGEIVLRLGKKEL